MSHVDEPSLAAANAEHAQRSGQRRWLTSLPWLAVVAYFAVVLRRAWLSDDAFITLRALDNLVNGYGLVSNPPERVLGFTHPLWALALLVPRTLGVNSYWSAMGLSLVLSLACALWIATRAAVGWKAGALALSWMAGSVAFVDFSTSGLENALAHLLLAAFFTAYACNGLAATAAWTWMLGALVVLNRLDHALLILPPLVSILIARAAEPRKIGFVRIPVQVRVPLREVAPAIAGGALLLTAWFSFALVYYGFALPNTAYAKLNTDLPPYTLLAQGARYFADGWKRDPLMMVVIVLGLLGVARERSRAVIGTSVGVALYLAYVASIGGDFMTGRFFTAPFLVCTVLLAARVLPQARTTTLLALLFLTAALVAARPTSLSASTKKPRCVVGASGIVIERQCYAHLTGLSKNLHELHFTKSPRFERALRYSREKLVVTSWNVGMVGYAAGPKVHVIDVFALTDPLLARLPYRVHDEFRIGHFNRKLPKGYRQSLVTRRNVIANPCLRRYYDVLSKVIRGPLFTRERWRAIVELNLGRHDHLLRKSCRLADGGS